MADIIAADITVPVIPDSVMAAFSYHKIGGFGHIFTIWDFFDNEGQYEDYENKSLREMLDIDPVLMKEFNISYLDPATL
jgi:hypothetical protein